jgi:hypothetical protein
MIASNKFLLVILALSMVITSCELWEPEEPELPMEDEFTEDIVTAPRYSLMAGAYSSDIEVELFTFSGEGTIYYTVDGTAPTAGSAEYTEPIQIEGDGTEIDVRAIALYEDDELSDPSASYYKIDYGHNPDEFDGDLPFEQIGNNIQGQWVGHVITKWVEPYNVDFNFNADGSYTAHALSPTNHFGGISEYWAPALYYGTDDDSPIKTFDIYDQTADGRGVADIVILFHVGTTNVDELKHISFSNEAHNYLEFELWHHGQYGPVEVKLTKKGS